MSKWNFVMNEYQVIQFTINYLKNNGLLSGPVSNEVIHSINELVQKESLVRAKKYGFASTNIPDMRDSGDEA